MAQRSSIEWTQSTWNPVTGCSKISPGCKHCYAERMANRLLAMGHPHYRDGFRVSLHPATLTIPLRWKRPQTIFVNSMSDLFHEEIPFEFIRQVFDVMNKATWHRFQVLTKRADRLAELSPKLDWGPNIWQGVTVESADYTHRIDSLRATGAQTKFLSIEPLLGPIPDLNLSGMDWVIVGGESGPGARPMHPEWAADLRDQVLAWCIPFYFKQWGGIFKKRNGRTLEGRTWEEMPVPPKG